MMEDNTLANLRQFSFFTKVFFSFLFDIELYPEAMEHQQTKFSFIEGFISNEREKWKLNVAKDKGKTRKGEEKDFPFYKFGTESLRRMSDRELNYSDRIILFYSEDSYVKQYVISPYFVLPVLFSSLTHTSRSMNITPVRFSDGFFQGLIINSLLFNSHVRGTFNFILLSFSFMYWFHHQPEYTCNTSHFSWSQFHD